MDFNVSSNVEVVVADPVTISKINKATKVLAGNLDVDFGFNVHVTGVIMHYPNFVHFVVTFSVDLNYYCNTNRDPIKIFLKDLHDFFLLNRYCKRIF